MAKEKPKPSEAELQILQILWQKGASSVRDVHELLSVQKDAGYTTTLKTMQRMLEKKMLLREDTAKAHLYKAALKEEETQSDLLDRILNTAFGGSASKMVLRALGSNKPSAEELKRIREYINKIEKGDI
ncbi:MAG: BlaI/MecI/CopY family transcriptional regulator [bacterium]